MVPFIPQSSGMFASLRFTVSYVVAMTGERRNRLLSKDPGPCVFPVMLHCASVSPGATVACSRWLSSERDQGAFFRTCSLLHMTGGLGVDSDLSVDRQTGNV